jgi:hypothetical protein
MDAMHGVYNRHEVREFRCGNNCDRSPSNTETKRGNSVCQKCSQARLDARMLNPQPKKGVFTRNPLGGAAASLQEIQKKHGETQLR